MAYLNNTMDQTAVNFLTDNLSIGILLITAALSGFLIAAFVGYKLFKRERSRFKAEFDEIELARQADQMRFKDLYEAISSLNSSLNYKHILENVLDTSITVLGAPGPSAEQLVRAVFLFKDDQNTGSPELYVSSARRFTKTDLRIVFPGDQGILAEVINTGESALQDNIDKDPELSRIVSLRMCSAVYCVPLRANFDTYGIFLFAHPETGFFSKDRRDILDMYSIKASIAIQNARLYHDLELEKERMLEIQEEARNKLARDLHDGPTQSIAAIAMRVNYARRMIERDGTSAAEELYKVEELARITAREIRHMLFTLRPLILESQGLVAALEAMAEKSQDTYSQNVIIQADEDIVHDLEMSKQAVIFYIVEEAVNNARKHAQSTHVWVRLKHLKKEVALLEIEDDGVGFNIGAVDAFYDKRGSLGLVNMRERAELVNGIMRIDSTEGRGTLVQVVLPLTEEATNLLRSRM